MAVLTSQLDRDAEEFARRRGQMEELVAELSERSAQIASGGGEQAMERTARAASCRRGSGWTASSIPAQPSSS